MKVFLDKHYKREKNIKTFWSSYGIGGLKLSGLNNISPYFKGLKHLCSPFQSYIKGFYKRN